MSMIHTTRIQLIPVLRLYGIFLTIFLCSSAASVHAQKSIAQSGAQQDRQGQQPRLDKASPFTDGFAQVAKGGRSYFIDTTGRYAFDKMFAVENHTDVPNNFYLVLKQDAVASKHAVTRKNKWGVVKGGQWILLPVYDTIDTRFNVWKVSKDGKSTWCDTTGKLLAPLRFRDMGYLDGHFFDVLQNGKWGIYDGQADSVVIPSRYDGFDYCGGCGMTSNYVLARKNGKWGVIGFDNKVRVPFAYEHEHFRMRSDEWVMSLRRKDKSVLINMRTGQVFSEPEYDIPDNVIWNGLACLGKNKKFGLVTPWGKPVTGFEYDYITWFDDMKARSADYACVEKHGQYGLIDTTGAVIIPIRHGGLIWAYDDSTFYMNGEEKKMLLDRAGNNLLPEYYKEITELTAGDEPPCLFAVSKNDKYGLYDRRSRKLTPLIYDDISATGLNGFIVTERDKKKGLFNLQGQEILPPVYDFIFREFSDTQYLSVKVYTPEGSRYGLATIRGQVLVAPQYTSIMELDGSTWLLQRDSSYFFFDSRTGRADSLPYKEVSLAGANALLLVSDENGTKLLDPVTRHIIGEGYESIYSFKNHMAIAQREGKLGMIDPAGKTVIPFLYSQLSEFRDGLAAVQKDDNDKYGFIDSTGREIIPITYDRPSGYLSTADYMTGDNLLLFRQDSATGDLLMGLARKDGTVMTPSQFDIVWRDEHGGGFLVRLRQNGRFGVLAANGKGIIPPIYDDMLPESINKYIGVADFTFPLLCHDGNSWKYVTRSGDTLPFIIKEVVRSRDGETPPL